jgi:hypothetical protein
MAVQSTLKVVYKALPIRINEDGSAAVTVRMGYIDGENFVVLTTKQVALDAAQAATILQAMPEAGKTRWDDLGGALYAYLIAQGYITGEIL